MADTKPLDVETSSITPLYDRLIVKRDETVKQVGSIILAENAKEPPNVGTVVSVGEGRLCPAAVITGGSVDGQTPRPFSYERCHVEPLRVKAGDRVLFQSYAGSEISVNGNILLLLSEDDILAIIS